MREWKRMPIKVQSIIYLFNIQSLHNSKNALRRNERSWKQHTFLCWRGMQWWSRAVSVVPGQSGSWIKIISSNCWEWCTGFWWMLFEEVWSHGDSPGKSPHASTSRLDSSTRKQHVLLLQFNDTWARLTRTQLIRSST